ncbi:MAG: type 4a pilus biogenesis protein PilO [bacterium]
MKPGAKKYNTFLKTILSLSLVLIVVSIIGGWYFIFNQSGLMSKAQTESIYAQKEYDVLSNLEIQLKKIADSSQIVTESLPKNKDVSSFIADVEQTAAGNGLATTEVIIGSQTLKGKANNQEYSQTISKDGYYELPMKLTFKGSYANVTKLLSDLNSYRRIVMVTGVDIKKDNAETNVSNDNVIAIVQLSIFSKK